MSAKSIPKVGPGDVLRRRELVTIHGTHTPVPDPERLVHLQFRRYAGCPICNLHLRTVAQRNQEIVSAGVCEVIVFHSSAEMMLGFQGELPYGLSA